MKRLNKHKGMKLYDAICSEENIREAIKKSCKDHGNDAVVQEMRADPEPFIKEIKHILETQSYEPSEFIRRTIYERGKKRKLCYTRTYPDRVIHHCVMNIVGPYLHSSIPEQAFAAVKGRGIHFGSMIVRKAFRNDPEGTRYCLKMDVYHYFESVDRDILFDRLKEAIRCHRTLDILHTIIFSCPGKKGLPIGLYASQVLSVWFLSPLDHYCKETLKLKHYFRYMDDIVVLSHSKDVLHNVRRLIMDFLHGMGLRLKGNHAIFPISSRKLDFIGFQFDHERVDIRKRIKVSFRRVCNQIIRMLRHDIPLTTHILKSLQSYCGMLTWVSSDTLYRRYRGKVDTALEFGVDAI